MDKQQAAEAHIKDLPVEQQQFAYKDFTDGWEAREALTPTDAVDAMIKSIENSLDQREEGNISLYDLESGVKKAIRLFKSSKKAPPAAGPVTTEKMGKALEQVHAFSTGKLGSKYLGCIIADCNAALEDYYKSETTAPQTPAGGPVWVKASERLPEKIGVYVLKNSNGDYILSYYNKSLELDFEGVIWLDDSQTTPAQQVFSREQVREAFSRGQVNALKKDAFITADEFMDKYYPLK